MIKFKNENSNRIVAIMDDTDEEPIFTEKKEKLEEVESEEEKDVK